MNKGAMFGLDARIALAIFGALSVISGAALYSAIENSKVVALLNEINEAGKAYEQYILDTGVDLEDIDVLNLKSSELASSTVEGWKGPYLPYASTGSLLRYSARPDTLVFFTKYKRSSVWTSTTNGPETLARECTDVKDCDLYITFREQTPTDFIKKYAPKLSEYVDGDDSLITGKVRIYENATFTYLYYKYMPAFTG